MLPPLLLLDPLVELTVEIAFDCCCGPREICGRDVTLNDGAGWRCLISIGTIFSSCSGSFCISSGDSVTLGASRAVRRLETLLVGPFLPDTLPHPYPSLSSVSVSLPVDSLSSDSLSIAVRR